MADISVAQKPSGQNTWMWALLAVLAVAGLMFWLASQSAELERVAAIQEEEQAAAAAAEREARDVEAVELSALAANPDGFAGRTLRLQGVNVAAALGPRAFWADVPGANPFLVVLGQSVQNVEMPVSGQVLNLTGTVQPVTEEQLNDWVQSGTVAEGSREEAAFATHVLLASEAAVQQ